jgi:hypothetical protein
VSFVAGAGVSVAADTVVVSDPETAVAAQDSLAIEITDTAIIDGIEDVENDQGGEVRLTWQRDLHDTTGATPPITHYTTWRRKGGFGRETWEQVGPSVAASAQPTYESVVPTASDSTGFLGIPWAVFYVSAHTSAPEVVSDFDPETASLLGVTIVPAWEPVGAPFAFVTAVDGAGNESEPSGTSNPTAAPGAILLSPGHDFLGTGRPNPFRESSRVDFGLRAPSTMSLVVYDVRGRRVRVLRDGPVAAGRSFEVWDGLDSTGRRAMPGVYFVRLESRDFRSTRKLVRVR